MALKDVVVEHRKARGWSQATLAARLGVTQQAISKIERGHLPGRDMLIALGEIFELPVDVLIQQAGISEEVLGAETLESKKQPEWIEEFVRWGQQLTPRQRDIIITLVRALAEEARDQRK